MTTDHAAYKRQMAQTNADHAASWAEDRERLRELEAAYEAGAIIALDQAHRILALTAAIEPLRVFMDEGTGYLPDIWAGIKVALEGSE